MGYRSEVLLAIAFARKQDRDEVWAVYCMDPRVQKYNIAESWIKNDDEESGVFGMWWQANCVKWYGGYEDVDAYEHLQVVAEQFADNRDMAYAWLKYRIGEETPDIEEELIENDETGNLQEYLWDKCGVSRSIHFDFR